MADYIELGEVAYVTKLAGFEFTKHFEYNTTGEIIRGRKISEVADWIYVMFITSTKRCPSNCHEVNFTKGILFLLIQETVTETLR